MADFLIAHNRTSKFEGGYQCMPDDNGNWTGGKKNVGRLVGTKFGISAPQLAGFLRREPTVDDMKNLSREDATMIYMKNFWAPIRGNEINSQELANNIYDMAVNGGTETAIILAQREVGLHETGIMDKITLDKLNCKS